MAKAKPAATDAAKFTSDEVGHLAALTRRANWLEQRVATSSPDRTGGVYDEKEYAALVWIMERVGANYAPGPYAGIMSGHEPSGIIPVKARKVAKPGVDRETPPLRTPVDGEVWTPNPARGRFFPGGQA